MTIKTNNIDYCGNYCSELMEEVYEKYPQLKGNLTDKEEQEIYTSIVILDEDYEI